MKGLWEQILGQEAKAKDKSNTSESGIDIDQALGMRLSELARRNIAIKIYSEVLGSEIWLCGNKDMANQLRQDDPEVIAYTADEMRKLIRLNPNPDDLRAIHHAKTVFPGSVVVDTSLKETNDGSDRI